MKAGILFASAGIAIAIAGIAAAADSSKCKLMQIAEWPVRPSHYRPVVDGSINGQKIGVLLDTGAAVSIISRSAAAKLGLRTSSVSRLRLFGVGGETSVEAAQVDEFRIGDAARKNWLAVVAGENEFQGDLAFLLGRDFFQQLDIEFDLAHRIVRLFETRDCDRARLSYWTNDALEVPLEPGLKIQLPVRVNGTRMVAELDSGATFSALSLEGAMQLGVTTQSAGIVSGGCTRGIGRVRSDEWIAPFESFAIGDELIRDPKIRVADLYLQMRYEETGSNLRRRLSDLADMVLGSDFLRSHRVLVARSQGKVYLSYTGGTVFPVAPGKPCAQQKD